MITELGKQGEKFQSITRGLNDPDIKKSYNAMHGYRSRGLILGLINSYFYWAKKEGDAFRNIDEMGYGFPFTNAHAARACGCDEMGAKETIKKLKSQGLFKTVLVPLPDSNRKVNYYILNPEMIMSHLLHTCNLAIEYEDALKEAEKEIISTKLKYEEAVNVLYFLNKRLGDKLIEIGFTSSATEAPDTSRIITIANEHDPNYESI